MTARQPPRPDGLNRSGNGKGMGIVTRPQPKKRGMNVDSAPRVPQVRRGVSTTTKATAVLVDPDKPLTDKQRLFVRLWAQGETITSASARAGYSDNATYAYRMIYMPNIRRLYDEEKRLYEEASQMTRKRVMEGLLEGIEMAKLMAEPASIITGWKTIGQMCGYFEPVKQKIELTVNGQIAIKKMESMSDADLLKLLDEGAPGMLKALPGIETGDEHED
jgi:hypothetical protein